MPINVGQAVGYLDLDVSKFNSKLKSAWKELEVFEKKNATALQKTSAVGKMLNGVGTVLSKNVTIPIAAAGAASLKASIDFESAFAGIRKTVDATDEEFGDLRKGILDMSKDIPKTASELASIGEVAGQLGIETENILGFTKSVAMLADTTNLSSEEAAMALSRFANITGMTQKDFDRLGSSVVALGNNLSTTEAEIVDMAQNIAAAGTQVGLTEDEILAISGALSSLGVEAAMGGTAFSKTIREMQLAVETGSEDLKNFANVANMSVDEFVQAFKTDSSEAIKAFIAGLGDTERLGSSTIKILKDLGIEETRMNDVLSRLANANELVNKSFEISNTAWKENTALVDEANRKYETTESQLKILWNNIVELGIQVGDILLPALNKIVKGLQNFVKGLSSMDKELLETIVSIGAFIAILGPVLSIIGKVILSFTNAVKIVKKLATEVKLLKAVFAALTGPAGVAVAAVGGLVAAVVLSINKTKLLSREYRELNKQIKENEKSYISKKEEIDKDTDSMISNALRAKDLYDEMVELSKQELDTATKVSILTAMAGELEKLIPGLVIEINKETGALETNKETVDGLVQSYIDLGIAKRFEEEYTNETNRFLDATKARQDAMENIARVEQEIKDNENWFNSLNFLGQSFGRQGYLTESQNLKQELADFKKTKDEQDKIIEESKANMQSFEKEKEEFTKNVYENLGIQVNTNKQIVKSEEDVAAASAKAAEEAAKAAAAKAAASSSAAKAVDEATEKEKDAVKEQEKLAEDSYKAEKERYDKLLDLTQQYYKDAEEIERKGGEKLKDLITNSIAKIGEINREYNDLLKDREDAIRSQFGLFDEFVKRDEDSLSGSQLLKNLKSQVKGIKSWREDLEKLTERGVSQGLIEELQEMGPKAAIEIDELTRLSDTKLAEYVKTWEELNEEINKQATKELAPEKEEANRKIAEVKADLINGTKEIFTDVQTNINQLKLDYVGKIQELGVTVNPEAKDVGIEIMKAIEVGIDENEETVMNKLNDLKDDIYSIVKSINRKIQSITEEAQDVGASISGSHRNGLSYVPYDGYVAQLHEGERVLTKKENEQYNKTKTNTGKQTLNVNFTGSLGQLIRVLKPEFTLEDGRGGVEY